MRIQNFLIFFAVFLYTVSGIPLRASLNRAPGQRKAILPAVKTSHLTVKPAFAPKVVPRCARTVNVKHPAKSCKCITKRAAGPVQSALRKTKASNFVGCGTVGRVFETTFQGQKAVIKITFRGVPGGSRENIEKEVRNLKAVGQFLAWGRNRGNDIFYIVMRDMGRPLSPVQSEITQAQKDKLIGEAKERYREQFHMVNNDNNPTNFVFHKVDGVWRAEIIDWARGKVNGHDVEESMFPAGNPEVVQEYDPDDPDQGCRCIIN